MPETTVELSPREREIATLVAKGKLNPEISRATGLAAIKVKEYVDGMCRKIPGVRTRAELGAWASRQGWV